MNVVALRPPPPQRRSRLFEMGPFVPNWTLIAIVAWQIGFWVALYQRREDLYEIAMRLTGSL